LWGVKCGKECKEGGTTGRPTDDVPIGNGLRGGKEKGAKKNRPVIGPEFRKRKGRVKSPLGKESCVT